MRYILRCICQAVVGIVALVVLGTIIAFANYAATQGSGTTFASVVISTAHYMANLVCDPTAGQSQCVGVNASGQLAVQAPPSLPLPSGAATSALQTTGNTSLSSIATNTTGASTAANQSTEIASLAQIVTNTSASIPAQTNQTTNIGAVSGIVNATPGDCSGTIGTGGTAQTLIATTATMHGFTLANIDAVTGSGEDIWFSFTGTATANTTSFPLAPIGGTIAGPYTWTSPMGFGSGHAVSIVSTTTGHKFSCTNW